VDHIKVGASNNTVHNFIHQLVDIHKLEASFIHRPEEQTVMIILHVPLVEASKLLPIDKFIPFPIHFNFSAKISVVPDMSQVNLIAIGHTRAFQSIFSLDLANSKCLGFTFICDSHVVLQTNIVKNCLGSLFVVSLILIKDNCKFRIWDTRGKFSDFVTAHG
jgi:hypothetical protein